jgi:phosphate-selective porin O/P
MSYGDESGTTTAATAKARAKEYSELRQQVTNALKSIHALEAKLDRAEVGGNEIDPSSLRQQLNEELEHIAAIERQLNLLEANATSANATPKIAILEGQPKENASASEASVPGPGAPAAPAIPAAQPVAQSEEPAVGYDNGFFIRSSERDFSLYLNGLFQIRYTGFKPHAGNSQFVPGTGWVNNFDAYLGRIAASGTLFDPSIKYFFQFQGITATDSNGVSMLDAFVSKTFSNAFVLQAGRFWTPYTYEYYDSPGNYLFADLSTAEYSFSLPRAIGVEASGQVGRLSYAGMVGNSVRALDAAGQDNFNSKVAYIGHVQYDILAPYGYVETDPSRNGVKTPELSLWASAAYNPIASPSGFENVAAGDKTTNATSTAGFRYGFLSLQTTGYFRRTTPFGQTVSNNSWGYAQQAGYYLVPGRFEVAERISGVNWGGLQFPLAGSSANSWFAGPSFPYHRVNEDSVGLNYYLHGHHAKLQLSYSYLHGNTFSNSKFGASRLWAQTQLMF